MKEKNNLKSKLKVIISIILCIIIILIALCIILLNKPETRRLRYIYNEKQEGNISITPTNVTALFLKYRGKVPQRTIYKAMDVFLNEIVQDYYLNVKTQNSEEIKKYYNKNKNSIFKELGLNNEEDFVDFINNIQKLNGEELILKEYTIHPKSVIKQNLSVKYVIIAKYENNEKIAFEFELLNSYDKKYTPIIYKAETDEKLLEYEYIPFDDSDIPEINSTGKVVE